MKVNLAYKYLLQPTDSQKKTLDTCFAVSRKAWNLMLDTYEKIKDEGEGEDKVKVSHRDKVKKCREVFTRFKQQEENKWMFNCPSRFFDFLITNNFNTAWDKFYKAAKSGDRAKAQSKYKAHCELTGKVLKIKRLEGFYKPKFKSWRDEQSFQADNRGASFDLKNNSIKLKMSGRDSDLSPIKFKIKKDDKIFLEDISKIGTFTFSRTNTGKYYLSVSIEVDKKVEEKVIESAVGIDLGVKDYVIAGDLKINMRSSERIDFRIKQLQLKAAQQYELNKSKNEDWERKNYQKTQDKIRRLQEKKANIRKYDTHAFTHSITEAFDFVATEDLAVKGMTGKSKPKLGEDGKTFVRNNKKQKAGLNRNILANNFGETVRQIQYKLVWKGKKFQKIGRFEPSSKLCHECGWKKENLELKDRTWACESCGVVHDRDINASLNIARVGLNKAGVNTPYQNAFPQGEEITPPTDIVKKSSLPFQKLTIEQRRLLSAKNAEIEFTNLLKKNGLHIFNARDEIAVCR